MMLIFLMTLLVVAIPVLHTLNAKSVQKIALFIGATQVACLALSGKIDTYISGFLVDAYNHLISKSACLLLDKIVCLFVI